MNHSLDRACACPLTPQHGSPVGAASGVAWRPAFPERFGPGRGESRRKLCARFVALTLVACSLYKKYEKLPGPGRRSAVSTAAPQPHTRAGRLRVWGRWG
jgi:hypothetical protein